MSRTELRRREALFGTFRDGLRPIRPYRWRTDAGALIEIPVTTMPVFRVPIHVSYVVYLSILAPRLAVRYFRAALALCRLTGTPPSVLLHPLDFLGCDDIDDLAFFPGMALSSGRKLELVGDVLRLLSEQFTVIPLREQARRVALAATLPVREPVFRHADYTV